MSARIPRKGVLLQNGEKHKVTVHGAPCRWKPYIQWGAAWCPKTRALLASLCHSEPHQRIPSTPVTASHVNLGRLEYESTIPQGTNKGLDLWEASAVSMWCKNAAS